MRQAPADKFHNTLLLGGTGQSRSIGVYYTHSVHDVNSLIKIIFAFPVILKKNPMQSIVTAPSQLLI